VQRFWEGSEPCGSTDEPYFVTADRELAQTTIDLLNDNLARAKKLSKNSPRYPYHLTLKGENEQTTLDAIREYTKALRDHEAQVDALVTEYDPLGGSASIDEYQIVAIEVR